MFCLKLMCSRWDLEEFRKEKLSIWTRDGFVFEGEQATLSNLNPMAQLTISLDTDENDRAYVASDNPRW